MRVGKYIAIVCILCISANGVFAIDYTDVSTDTSYRGQVSKDDIYQANILRTYLTTYQEKIESIVEKNNIQSDMFIQDIQVSLRDMKLILGYIIDEKVAPDQTQKIMLSIVDDLKSINQRLQNFLKQRDNERQEKVAQVQSRYNQVVHKITTILDSIVYDFTQALIQKSSHTDKEKEIILQLSKVQAERNKIARFKTIRFSDEEAMRSYLKKSVVSIRRELLKLRDML